MTSDPRLSDLDPLVPKRAPAEDPFAFTEEDKAAIAEKAAAAQRAQSARVALIEAVDAYHATHGHGTRPAVLAAVEEAEACGLKVDRGALVAYGALEAPDDQDIPDLDAIVEPEAEEEEPEPPPVVKPAVDLRAPVDGMVPMYNPTDAPIGVPYNGRSYVVRAQGVDLVHEQAAVLAVGVDNHGGTLSKIGLRRLYWPEERFAAAAKKDRLPLEVWVQRRNAGVKMLADATWKRVGRAATLGGGTAPMSSLQRRQRDDDEEDED